MESKRQQKFSKMIQRELADIFQKNNKGHFSGNIISVTRVEMSPDLSLAKAHLSFVLDEGHEEMFERVNNHKGDVRRDLGNRIGKIVRKVPELAFVLDEGAAHAQRMEELFKKIKEDKPNLDQKEN